MFGQFEAGRSASNEMLAAALPSAPLPYLEGALANPALTPRHVLLLLKNPHVVVRLIQHITRNRDWMRAYEVRAAIVLHPKTPRAVGMNLVTLLWWRDLARVVDRPPLAPPLRRTAERLLGTRLQEMTLGEKISLARIASRGVINSLRRDDNPMVIRALLHNPRLVEEDVIVIASGPRTPRSVLQVLSEDSRWSARPAVRRAIARHPGTPAQVALGLVRHMTDRDLREVLRGPHVPGLIRVGIQRLLESRRASARRKAD
ncbi:MAG: hypothetical protein ACE5JH_11210 [Acidobacteriota bacterium]